MACHVCRSCWRLAMRRMDAAIVEVPHKQGNGMAKVFECLGVTKRGAIESARELPHR